MRHKRRFLSLVILLLALSCHKTAEDTGPKSTWTVDGDEYTEGTTPTFWDDGGSALIASDNSKNGDIEIIFANGRPSPGSYSLVVSDTCYICSAQCTIDVHTPTDSYISSGSGIVDVS